MLNFTNLTLTPPAARCPAEACPSAADRLGQGLSNSGSQTFASNTAGVFTLSPTVASATNATLGGPASAGTLTTATLNVFSGSGKWTSGSGTAWSANGNWTDANGVHAAPGTFAGFNTDTAVLDGSGTASTIGLDVPVILSTLSLAAGGPVTGYTIAGGGSNMLTMYQLAGGGSIAVSSGSHSISAPVVLAGSLAVSMTGGASLTISGNISESLPGQALALGGNGLLILTGSNTYSGSTTVDGGTLQVSAGQLSSPIQFVGNSGTGSFVQSGGSNLLGSSGLLYLGNAPGASGSYTLS